MSEFLDQIEWAINTIRDQVQFGLDPLSAAKARERRAKGVLLNCKKEILKRDTLIVKFAAYMEIEGVLSPEDIEEMEKLGIKYDKS